MIVKVASYNVHSFVGSDGRRDATRVGRVLQSLDADVIALQEVEFEAGERAPAALLAALPGYQAICSPIERAGQPFGNALLTRLPTRSARRICLSYPCREPRTALEVVLETGARPLRVVATHLGLRPVERRFQVKKILEHVAGDETSVTVLLGDFNEWFLVGRPLRWLHARYGRGPDVRTFPARFPLFALDRIWVHPRGALAGFGAWREGEARVASDHLPVVARVSV